MTGAAVLSTRSIRTLGWLIRREFWEHRSLVVAPAVVAGFVALMHFLSAVFISDAARLRVLADPSKSHEFMSLYGGSAMAILIATLLTSALYCLDALQGERRDRSILFWKSLPVSDRLTIASKALIPLAFMPIYALALIVGANIVMVTLQSLVWWANGVDARELWARLELPFMWLCLLIGLPFMALWFSPLYAWFLFVSGWARRAALLIALAPIAAILIVETMVLQGRSMWGPVQYRIIGGFLEAFTADGDGHTWLSNLSHLNPVRLYAQPGLWVGLIIAAALFAVAARQRRERTQD